jgi:cytochrome c-type biogenesis protein CcmF
MDWLLNGTLGNFWVALSFAAAFTACASLAFSLWDRSGSRQFELIGLTAFWVHGAAVLMILFTLVGMILTHHYEYHYVWSHSSNELPLQYVVACLWEGQEGSFLIWMVWHVLLAAIVYFRSKAWRTGVLAVVCSVQVLLSSMLLGVHLQQTLVAVLLGMAALLAVLAVWRTTDPTKGNRLVTIGLAALVSIGLVVLAFLPESEALPKALNWALLMLAIGLAGYTLVAWHKGMPFATVAVLLGLSALLGGMVWAGPGAWDAGSSPFMLLKDAFPDAEAYKADPNFIPVNGNGLNPLLQNYWMVIHPPTLFMGFASTLIPFAFLTAGLLKQDYTGWIKPATPWVLYSTMILGVGIIMGGYWAYETLNFGGYWNWDPVENASLVPWLTAVAGLHGLVIYRRGKSALALTAVLITLTFLLVLYSTFLTRSGILGDSSVHSFTDLGLSGQLLVLLLAYVLGITLLLADRWKKLPSNDKEPGWQSVEFYLLLAIMVFCFSAVQIAFSTSIPVFNKLFGTTLAPPAKATLFYYKWNVWFGIAIAILSGVGQYFFWTKVERKTITQALFRPLIVAAVIGLGITGLLVWQHWEFAFHKTFLKAIQGAEGISVVGAYLTSGLLMYADDILLICSLFTLLANADIIVRLVRKSRTHLARIGGALAHIGFGLMLVGILFSSGYESTVSINLKPHLLGTAFPEESKQDNVLLIKDQPEIVMGYRVVYRGKLQAQSPLSELAVVTQDATTVKVRFRDSKGYIFSQVLPTEIYNDIVKPVANAANKGPDLEKLRDVLEKNLPMLQPKLLNDRSLYTLVFTPLGDTSQHFTLLPEAEVNENMGLVAHPDRKVSLDNDLYVHVTSIPGEDKPEQRKRKESEVRVAIGDTFQLERSTVVVEKIVRVSEVPEYANYALAVRLKLKVISRKDGSILQANPTMLVDAEGQTSQVDVHLQPVGAWFSFLGADPVAKKIIIRIAEEPERPDYLTFKAIKKPFINLLWLGTFVLTAGFLLAIVRRVREGRRKGEEA